MAERAKASLAKSPVGNSKAPPGSLLMNASGELDPDRVRDFLAQRNNRLVNLRE